MTISHDPTIPLRRCSKCRESFPATRDYFHEHSDGGGRLRSDCKRCRNRQVNVQRKGKPRDGRSRKNSNGVFCNQCCSLPHRRPKTGACLCGGHYEPMRAKTSWDVMAEPRANNTTYPDSNGLE